MEKAIRFSIENKQFVRSLKTATRVINRKNALPILGDVKLELQDSRLTMTSGNSEAFITQPMADYAILDGDKAWAVCMDPATLISALGEIGDRRLIIDIDTKMTMQVQYVLSDNPDGPSGRFSLPVESADEYPVVQEVQAVGDDQPTEFRLPAAWLLREVQNARASVGSDELRPVFNSICLDADREGLCLVSTDGHTLYSTRYEWGLGNPEGPFIRSGEPRQVLIDKQVHGALSDAFQQAEAVTVRCNGHHVALSAEGGAVVTCVMCEQRYPSWRSVLPQQSPYTATVEARALLSALRRVNPFSSEGSNMVKLSFDAGRLTVTAEDYDFSRAASENVAIQDTNLPDGFAIGLKNSSFMAMLQVAAKTENVVLSLADASRAILIKPEDHNDATTALVMPMLLNEA